MGKKINRDMPGKVATAVFWLAMWQAAALLVGKTLLLPGPVDTLRALTDLVPSVKFWARIGQSVLRILGGFGAGLAAAGMLAAAGYVWPWVRLLLSPLMRLAKAAPVASFVILALLWVSSRNLAVLISFLMALPVLYGAILAGLEQADPKLLEMARVYRLQSWAQVRYLWLPALLPELTHGCATALGLCWKSGIAAEVIGLPDGTIGEALYNAKISLSSADVFAWTVVILCLSAVFERLLLWLLRLAARALCGGEASS